MKHILFDTSALIALYIQNHPNHENCLNGSSWQNPTSYDVSGISYDRDGNLGALTRRTDTGPANTYGYSYASGSNRLYYCRDHHAGDRTSLGSTRAVANASGSVVETQDYYPCGLAELVRPFDGW